MWGCYDNISLSRQKQLKESASVVFSVTVPFENYCDADTNWLLSPLSVFTVRRSRDHSQDADDRHDENQLQECETSLFFPNHLFYPFFVFAWSQFWFCIHLLHA